MADSDERQMGLIAAESAPEAPVAPDDALLPGEPEGGEDEPEVRQEDPELAAARDATEQMIATLGPADLPTVGTPRDVLSTPEAMQHAWRIGGMMAASPMVPDHLRGNQSACTMTFAMAMRLGADPMMVAQEMFLVHGRPGFSAKFMIARLNQSGKIKGRVRWRVNKGKDAPGGMAVTAYAIDAETGEEYEATVDLEMAKADGWAKNTKYRTLPEFMLRYRSVSFLVRFYFPEIMSGALYTPDELREMHQSTNTLQLPGGGAGKLAAFMSKHASRVQDAEVLA